MESVRSRSKSPRRFENRRSSISSLSFRSRSPNRLSINSYRRTHWKPLKISNFTLGIVMIFGLAQVAYACDKIIPITHNESMRENGKCKLITTQKIEFDRLQKNNLHHDNYFKCRNYEI